MSHWTFDRFGIKEQMKFFEVELVFLNLYFFDRFQYAFILFKINQCPVAYVAV